MTSINRLAPLCKPGQSIFIAQAKIDGRRKSVAIIDRSRASAEKYAAQYFRDMFPEAEREFIGVTSSNRKEKASR